MNCRSVDGKGFTALNAVSSEKVYSGYARHMQGSGRVGSLRLNRLFIAQSA
jgi:hypothetical protein